MFPCTRKHLVKNALKLINGRMRWLVIKLCIQDVFVPVRMNFLDKNMI